MMVHGYLLLAVVCVFVVARPGGVAAADPTEGTAASSHRRSGNHADPTFLRWAAGAVRGLGVASERLTSIVKAVHAEGSSTDDDGASSIKSNAWGDYEHLPSWRSTLRASSNHYLQRGAIAQAMAKRNSLATGQPPSRSPAVTAPTTEHDRAAAMQQPTRKKVSATAQQFKHRMASSLATAQEDGPTAAARRNVYTSASQIISILPYDILATYCYAGYTGVELSTSTTFNCTRYDASSGSTSYVVEDAITVRDLPKAQRANCSYMEGTSPSGKQCLCSSDYFLFRSRPTFFGCLPRNITCLTAWRGLSNCRLPGYAEPEPDMDHCYALNRRKASAGGSTVGNLTLAVECSISSNINAVLYETIGAVAVSPSNASTTWLPTNVTVDNGAGQQPTGTFASLSVDPYLFPSAYEVLVANESAALAANSSKGLRGDDPTVLRLTQQHPLVTYGTFEVQFFDLDQPSRTDGGGKHVTPLVLDSSVVGGGHDAATIQDATGNVVATLGLLASRALWNITFDISTLPGNYFYGGRLYMEAGIVSPFGLTSRYSVSVLEIEILDTPDQGPARTYDKPLEAGVVALIAVGVACAVFLVAVVVWKILHQPAKEDVGLTRRKAPPAPAGSEHSAKKRQ